MPMVVAGAAASALIAGSTFSIAAGLSIGFSISTFAGSLVLGLASYALTPKPKKPPPITQINSSTFTVRQPDSTRKYIYGMTRFTDVYAHIVAGNNNGKMHAMIIICTGEAESIDEIWVNDYAITPDMMDANGNVTSGRYAGKLRIRIHLGSPTQVADTVAVSEVTGWSSTDRLQNICYAFVTMTKNQDVYPNGVPNFSFIGKFRKIYDPRTGVTRWTPNVMLFCYDYLAQAHFGFEASEADINLTNISAGASICDEIVDTVAIDSTITSVSTSTDILTLDGDMLKYEICDRVRLISSASPATLPGGLADGIDYYVIPYQIKGTPRIKLAASLDDAIDGTAINITSSGSGTMTIRKTGEPRYHGAGAVDTADTLEDNLNSMLASMAGRAVCTGGAWRLLPGAWQEPTEEFDLGDLVGQMETQTKVPMSDRFNMISGVFIAAINNYQKADYPSVKIQFYVDRDNGRVYPRQLPLNYTTRPTTAKRIAKLEYLRATLEKVHSFPCGLSGLRAQVGDNFMFTHDRRGWEQKPFEMTQFQLSIEGDEDNPQVLCNITGKETAEAVYEWASSEDDPTFDLAPNTNLVDAFTVPAVTGFAFSSRAVESVDGDLVYNLVGSWDAHPDAFVQNHGVFEIQFKLSSETEYRRSFEVPGETLFTDIVASSVNTAYDIRIRARTSLGVRSNWTTIEGAVVGSSGGVGTTNNWGAVNDAAGTFIDYGAVNDAVGTTDDWGTVV